MLNKKITLGIAISSFIGAVAGGVFLYNKHISASLIRNAEHNVSDKLIDGDSARFKDEKIVYDTKSGKAAAVCGMLNGKNRFGGYVGWRGFIFIATPFYDLLDSSPIEKNIKETEANTVFLEEDEENSNSHGNPNRYERYKVMFCQDEEREEMSSILSENAEFASEVRQHSNMDFGKYLDWYSPIFDKIDNEKRRDVLTMVTFGNAR